MTDKKQDEKSFDSSKINTQELQKYKQDYSCLLYTSDAADD